MSVKSVIQDYRRIYNAVNKMSGNDLQPTVNADIALALLQVAEKRIKEEEAKSAVNKVLDRFFGAPASRREVAPPAPETEVTSEEANVEPEEVNA
jgi:hypothetical protein